MQSTLPHKPNDDPHDIVVVAPDAIRMAPSNDELSSLLHQAARLRTQPQVGAGSESAAGATVPPVDTTFRPTAVDDLAGNNWSMARRALRALMTLLLAGCIGLAAIAWKAYGDTAKKQFAKWTTQFVFTASVTPEEPGHAAQPPVAAADGAIAAESSSAAPAQNTADAAAPSPGQAQMLQSMTRDLASLGQEVEQLKTSIEQLKANEQQMSRELAKASEVKASEPNARPRIAALPPRPPVARARKPAPSYPPPQAAAAPALPPAPAPYYAPRQPDYAPRQVEPQPQLTSETLGDPELSSVPRPPMPVR